MFAPLVLVLFLIAAYNVVRTPGMLSFCFLVLVVLVAIAGVLARSYALKVQDRVIRLEERLRLLSVLPAALHADVMQLSEQQLIALRFASDNELTTLAQRTLRERLGAKQIRALIKDWRPDTWRV